MTIRSSQRGYAFVEAALVFPLVIMIIVTIILSGLTILDHVRNDSAWHVDSIWSNSIRVEDILRGKWILGSINSESNDKRDIQTE